MIHQQLNSLERTDHQIAIFGMQTFPYNLVRSTTGGKTTWLWEGRGKKKKHEPTFFLKKKTQNIPGLKKSLSW